VDRSSADVIKWAKRLRSTLVKGPGMCACRTSVWGGRLLSLDIPGIESARIERMPLHRLKASPCWQTM
jgi:hypothetical protein